MKPRTKKEANQRNWPPWLPWGDHPWIVAIAVIAGVLSILVSVIDLRTEYKKESPAPAVDTPALVPPNPSIEPVLPEEQARRRIMDFLHEKQLGQAIDVAAHLPSGSAQQEECEHIWKYSRENSRLDELQNERGNHFVSMCWQGAERRAKMEELGLALLHKSNGGTK